MAAEKNDWTGVARWDWEDPDTIRARLEAGADPDARIWGGRPVLHVAAELGSPEAVAELAARARDIDAEYMGRTALWEAVFARCFGNARVLAEAGADPWRPMMAGWPPGRLALAGPNPDLFPLPEGRSGLSPAESAAVAEARRMVAVLGDVSDYIGMGVACVAGIDAAEAARRLQATPITDTGPGSFLADPWSHRLDGEDGLTIVGATDVSGGCVITQPWGYAPQMPGVLKALSAGTVCYGMYANPKSGDQGSICRDGVLEDWDLIPGAPPGPDASSREVLLSFLYQDDAVGYACAYAGLRLTDARAVTGPPDVWLRLPRRDYWQ
ncbi:ankyrin repeat domain-containing protein [Thermomonospora curvata]|uniref:Uncharacterized protein n=1 Tax=Thermomonospora curvata (strain ATCC 19995 / DSM 43183 / JCM 3096 / KCTC 9072 / NBRC 15933 / NCIMB 10081 / Henssen B9) TaxID=471852 RepID=D1A5J7_THECD|nr:ankyrin repeat domain-containing protein [Thermomonospora curvata]ACY96357.1 hypothetical protein Tcur_0765 [Thermomonospora curvata DSM 43183]